MQNQPLNQENPDSQAPATVSEAPAQSTTPEAALQNVEATQTIEAPKPAETAQATLPEVEPAVETKERKQAALNHLEAALYVAGRPLDLNEMGQVVGSRSKKKSHRLRRGFDGAVQSP